MFQNTCKNVAIYWDYKDYTDVSQLWICRPPPPLTFDQRFMDDGECGGDDVTKNDTKMTITRKIKIGKI